ncbi:O-acetyl-ADP-ribose deacetylase MACROD1 [Crotalus adamanteus]|uniref:O-acetyl-ADP-ribose deacetylase MACROD1 n=1 Tax=Crotalus adamanteus TaxID=8729 RepID=A0AAW1AMW1_CROAD
MLPPRPRAPIGSRRARRPAPSAPSGGLVGGRKKRGRAWIPPSHAYLSPSLRIGLPPRGSVGPLVRARGLSNVSEDYISQKPLDLKAGRGHGGWARALSSSGSCCCKSRPPWLCCAKYQQQRLLGSLGRLWREWGGCPIAVHAGGKQGDWARLPLGKSASRWVFAQGIRSWAIAAPLAMAAKVDLTTSTDWKEAKSFLKGLNNKQRRPHYFTKDFVKLKQIPTWKEMAKSARIQQPEETIYPKDNNLNGKISLLRGDITKLEVDAIVNAASRAKACRGPLVGKIAAVFSQLGLFMRDGSTECLCGFGTVISPPSVGGKSPRRLLPWQIVNANRGMGHSSGPIAGGRLPPAESSEELEHNLSCCLGSLERGWPWHYGNTLALWKGGREGGRKERKEGRREGRKERGRKKERKEEKKERRRLIEE